MSSNNFLLDVDRIKPVATGIGACLASNRITVDGLPVRFMYREKAANKMDSGWRFFSGVGEDSEYVNDPSNIQPFDVNTIANYDSTIIPLLKAPVGSVFEKLPQTEKWVPVTDY